MSEAALRARRRAALRDFHDDYCACLDDADLERWPDFFVDDCRYRVLSKENHDAGLPLSLIYCDGRGMLLDRVMALRESTVYEPRSLRHFVSACRITGEAPNGFTAQSNFLIIESLSDREPTVNLVGRYLDSFVESDQGIRLRDRWCVVDNYRIRTSLVIPV